MTASRRTVRLRSWRALSLCHLHGIQMPLCRALDMSVMTLRSVHQNAM
jgi:hypothetical protein